MKKFLALLGCMAFSAAVSSFGGWSAPLFFMVLAVMYPMIWAAFDES